MSGTHFEHSDRFDILLSNSFLSNLDISNADKLQFHESFKIDIKLTKRSTNLEPDLKKLWLRLMEIYVSLLQGCCQGDHRPALGTRKVFYDEDKTHFSDGQVVYIIEGVSPR